MYVQVLTATCLMLLLMATSVMATARLCGTAPDLSIIAIMAPLIFVMVMMFVMFFFLTIAFICRNCDTECAVKSFLFLCGWTLTVAMDTFVTLFLLNVYDKYVCLNWGVVVSPLIAAAPTSFLMIYLVVGLFD